MSKILLLICFLLFIFVSNAQNLISNSGFENGLSNWADWWSRDNKGNVSVMDINGNTVLKIFYPSDKDWSFSTGTRFEVEPGQLYEITCKAKIDSIAFNGKAQFSVILYDESQNVIDWDYSANVFSMQIDSFQNYSTRFFIPDNVAFIEPRFMGWGSCSIYVDNAQLMLEFIQSLKGDYSIENDSIKAKIHLPLFSITFTNKLNQVEYKTASAPIMIVDSIHYISNSSMQIKGKFFSENEPLFELILTAQNRSIKFNLNGDSTLQWDTDLRFPGIINSNADDYMIIPRATGVMIPVNKSYPYYNFNTYAWKSTMPFIGISNLSNGYMISTDDQWDAKFKFEKPAGQNNYSFQFLNMSSKGVMGYNRTIYFNLVENGYVEMCQWYRKHAEQLGYVKTLKQKNIENGNIEKLIGAVDFWAINGSVTSSFLDEMKNMGLDKAIWNLSGGWQTKDFSNIIDSINAKGYLSSRYDIYTDVFPPTHPEAPWYRTEGYPDDVIVNANGQLREGWLAYINNEPYQGYYTCSKTHLDYCKNNLPLDLSQNRYNCRFIDVELASSLTECYSDVHPATRKQDAMARNELLAYIKNDHQLVVGDEEAHDFAFQNVDYGEGTMTIETVENAGYDWSTPVFSPKQTYIDNNISPTIRVPLHGLCFHDVHIPTWYTGDGVSKAPEYWDDKNLWNILYGTMPLYMPPSESYWIANFERFIGGYHLISAVTRNVGYDKMINHQFITPNKQVQKTTFSNGWNVIANFDTISYNFENMKIAPKGFYASDGQDNEAYKLIEDNDTIDWAFANNRLFFNSHGAAVAKNGIKTVGGIFIQKQDTYLLLSFIGKQTDIDLNAALLPFNISNINKAYDWKTKNEVPLVELDNGWKRLSKLDNALFYMLTYNSTTALSITESLKVEFFPNPVKTHIKIESSKEIVRVQITDLAGKEVYETFQANKTIEIDVSKLQSGFYLCSINFNDGSNIIRKIIKE